MSTTEAQDYLASYSPKPITPISITQIKSIQTEYKWEYNETAKNKLSQRLITTESNITQDLPHHN